MVHQALRAVTRTSLPEFARLCGIGYHTLRSYVLERRTPSPESSRLLAKGLRAHARRLVTMAEDLERQAERNP